MTLPSLSIRPETAEDNDIVESLAWSVFGPGMTARAAHVLREGTAHEIDLSFVAEIAGRIIGTVRLTRILIGDEPVLMLGPLAVLPEYKSQGAGKRLMKAAVNAAKSQADAGGPKAIMLVGDYPYYKPFGFNQVAPGSIQLPRPADPSRILVCPLIAGAKVEGEARRIV